MKTHYLENNTPVCGTQRFRKSVNTKTGWYGLSENDKCKHCQRQIYDRCILGHVHKYDEILPEI